MTAAPLRVLVLDGGPDRERPVSLASGANVAAALAACPDVEVTHRTIDRPSANDLAALVRGHAIDVVFPVLHGPWGEGGPLQEALAAVGCAFVGAGDRAATLAMDKARTKALVVEAGVDTAPWCVVEQPADLGPGAAVRPPLVLKPVDDGSSVDMAFCDDDAQVARALPTLLARRGRLLAERRIVGREVTVGIVGRAGGDGRDPEALPLVEIVPAGETYDYAAKYERDDTRYRIGHEVPPLGGVPDRGDVPLEEVVRSAALAAWRRVGARDLARVDFLVERGASTPDGDDGPRAWFLELNTMPGFTSHSLLPMAARAAGLDEPALVRRLVGFAAARAATDVAVAGARD